jgi:predicted secreted protein
LLVGSDESTTMAAHTKRKVLSAHCSSWFIKGMWQWLLHYRNTMLDTVNCLRYTAEDCLPGMSGTWPVPD